MKHSSVGIILTTWNHWDDTKVCLDSLAKSSYMNATIIVVDNHSTDETVRMIKKKYTQVVLIENISDIPYAESVNQGLRKSLAMEMTYSLLLNNDTAVDAECIARLVKRLDADKQIGIVAPKMYFYDDPKIIWYAGGIADLKQGVVKHRGFGEKDHGQYDHAEETNWCTGCCTLYRNSMLTEIGLVDEEYEMYVSDVEHSIRAKKYGYRSFYDPSAFMWHKVSRSRSATNPYKESMKSRELVRFFYSESKIGMVRYMVSRLFQSVHFIRPYGINYAWAILSGLFDGLIYALSS